MMQRPLWRANLAPYIAKVQKSLCSGWRPSVLPPREKKSPIYRQFRHPAVMTHWLAAITGERSKYGGGVTKTKQACSGSWLLNKNQSSVFQFNEILDQKVVFFPHLFFVSNMGDGTQGRSDLEISARAYSVQQPTSPPSDLHFDGLSAPSIPPRPAHGLHFDRLVPPPAYIRGREPPVYCSGRPTRWAGYGSVRAPHCASARAASPHKMPSSPLLPSAPMCLFSNLTRSHFAG